MYYFHQLAEELGKIAQRDKNSAIFIKDVSAVDEHGEALYELVLEEECAENGKSWDNIITTYSYETPQEPEPKQSKHKPPFWARDWRNNKVRNNKRKKR